MTSPKIAFIKMGSFSLVNMHIEEILKNTFPEYHLDVFDVVQDFVNDKSIINILSVMRWYGFDFISGKRILFEELSQQEILSRTTNFYNNVKRSIIRQLEVDEYAFSFQTQSLFDASIPGLPHFVYTDHTHLANLNYQHFDESMLYSNAWIDLEREIYQRAKIVFTTSNFVTKSLVEDYSCAPEKANCVYSGINVEPEIDIPGRSYGNKHILFVGINWKRKAGPLLIEAFKRVLHAHPDSKLTIIGSQPKIDVARVSVIGRVPSSEVSHYYMDASIFCLPSFLEPSAAVLAEAAAHGLPVVSTDIGGTPDRVIHGETGYLVEPGDIEGLARYLIDLLDDQEKRAQFGQRGYELAIERFRWEEVGNRIEANIRAALQG